METARDIINRQNGVMYIIACALYAYLYLSFRFGELFARRTPGTGTGAPSPLSHRTDTGRGRLLRQSSTSETVPASASPRSGASAVSPAPSAPVASGILSGKSFSITGKMPVKRDLMEMLIRHYGGVFHRNPTRGTDYLIVGESRRVSGKETAAQRNGVQAITLSDFAALCGVTANDICTRFHLLLPIADIQAYSRQKSRNKAAAAERARERRELSALKQQVAEAGDIYFTKPVQVVATDGEGMELANIVRMSCTAVGDCVAYTTKGESIYLDDLRGCSIADLLEWTDGGRGAAA